MWDESGSCMCFEARSGRWEQEELPWATKRDNTHFNWDLEMLVLESSIMGSIHS